ncbi:MAG: 50S ribosomal protein L13 [Minisyncoccia bacterium]
MTKDIYTIDASGKKLGRVASEAAKVLIGKNSVSYAPNIEGDTSVVIENTSKLIISDKKKKEKIYRAHSQYPGGLTEEAMGHLIARRGIEEIVKKAVDGMLPKNKLRKPRMKRLTVKK